MARRRLLVADDSATIQKVIKIAFSRHQYDIVEAASFIEALTAQSRAAADIVIADASLPGAHGPADFSKLTQNGRTPLLLLVGSYESVDEESFRTLGFSQFLKKPFESADIVALVDRMMSGMPDAMPPLPPDAGAGSTLVAGSDRSAHTTVIHEGGIGLSFSEESYAGQGKTDPVGRPRVSPAFAGAPAPDAGFVPPPPQGFMPMPSDAPPPPPQAFVDESKKGRKAFSGEGEPSGFKLAAPSGAEGGRVPPPPAPGFAKPRDLGDLTDLGFMSQSSDMDMTPPARMPTEYRPASGAARASQPPAPAPVPAVRPEDYLDKIEKLVEDSVDDRLPPLVRKAIEDYCDRHFKTLAREVITNELRRLAEEKARHLVDN